MSVRWQGHKWTEKAHNWACKEFDRSRASWSVNNYQRPEQVAEENIAKKIEKVNNGGKSKTK